MKKALKEQIKSKLQKILIKILPLTNQWVRWEDAK
jgi:hypothetical protein